MIVWGVRWEYIGRISPKIELYEQQSTSLLVFKQYHHHFEDIFPIRVFFLVIHNGFHLKVDLAKQESLPL